VNLCSNGHVLVRLACMIIRDYGAVGIRSHMSHVRIIAEQPNWVAAVSLIQNSMSAP